MNHEYLPPMSSGTTKVSYPSCVARLRNAPFLASVVANILSAACSLYFVINNSLLSLKAMAGSVVVPDFEDMLIIDLNMLKKVNFPQTLFLDLF